MKIKLVAAAALVASFAAPAFAADEFLVVQDVKTKKCTIVDKKPTESAMTVVSPAGTVLAIGGGLYLISHLHRHWEPANLSVCLSETAPASGSRVVRMTNFRNGTFLT